MANIALIAALDIQGVEAAKTTRTLAECVGVGFYVASSMERLPTEEDITARVAEFIQLRLTSRLTPCLTRL